MPSDIVLQKAMEEWLTTVGLHPAEQNMIIELQRVAASGEPTFMATAEFFARAMPDIVISAVVKAREQGICKEWPSA